MHFITSRRILPRIEWRSSFFHYSGTEIVVLHFQVYWGNAVRQLLVFVRYSMNPEQDTRWVTGKRNKFGELQQSNTFLYIIKVSNQKCYTITPGWSFGFRNIYFPCAWYRVCQNAQNVSGKCLCIAKPVSDDILLHLRKKRIVQSINFSQRLPSFCFEEQFTKSKAFFPNRWFLYSLRGSHSRVYLLSATDLRYCSVHI